MALLFGLAILLVILIPFVPALLRLRIRFFRWIHWTWAFDVHEKYFDGLVLFARITMFLLAALLLYIAW